MCERASKQTLDAPQPRFEIPGSAPGLPFLNLISLGINISNQKKKKKKEMTLFHL